MPVLRNSRHEAFAQQIASGTCSAAEAYRRAGGRTKNADVIACRWLRKVSIKERIAELKGRAAEKCDMTREQTVRALSGIFQAKPSEASLENPLCEMIISKVGPAAVFPSKLGANSSACENVRLE
jgi:phage terminase small subunit